MRITGRQLRSIIKEEVERMMEEDGPTDTIQVMSAEERSRRAMEALKGTHLGSILARAAAAKPYSGGEVNVYGARGRSDIFDKVFDRLMQGEIFDDSNADTDVKLVVNTFINSYDRQLKLGLENLPTSPFSKNLMVLQRLLKIPADGKLGLQTYLAIVTSGQVIMPSKFIKLHAAHAAEVANKALRGEEHSASLEKLIKAVGAARAGSAPENIKLNFGTPAPRGGGEQFIVPLPVASPIIFSGGRVEDVKSTGGGAVSAAARDAFTMPTRSPPR